MTDTAWRRYSCPLPECTWVYDQPPPPGVEPTGDLDAGMPAILRAWMTETEGVVKAHLETHPLLEWAQEVARLNGIRANVARELGPDSPIGAMIGAVASHDSPAAVSWRACLDWLRDDG